MGVLASGKVTHVGQVEGKDQTKSGALVLQELHSCKKILRQKLRLRISHTHIYIYMFLETMQHLLQDIMQKVDLKIVLHSVLSRLEV